MSKPLLLIVAYANWTREVEPTYKEKDQNLKVGSCCRRDKVFLPRKLTLLQLKTLMNKDNGTVEQVVLPQSVTLQFMPMFLSKFILIYTLKIKKWYKETQCP